MSIYNDEGPIPVIGKTITAAHGGVDGTGYGVVTITFDDGTSLTVKEVSQTGEIEWKTSEPQCNCHHGSAGCPIHDPAVAKTEPVSPMVDMWLLVWGNPMDGLTFEGPFFSADDATEAAGNNSADWHIAEIERPATLQQTKSEIMREVADSLGLKVIDLPLGKASPEDLIGIPVCLYGEPGKGTVKGA